MATHLGIGWLDLANVAGVAALAAVAGLVATAMLRGKRPMLAHEVAGLAAALVLLAPGLGGWGGRQFGLLRVGGGPDRPRARVEGPRGVASPPAPAPGGSEVAIGKEGFEAAPRPAFERATGRVGPSALDGVLAAWGLGSLIALARIASRGIRARGVARRAREVADPRVLDALRRSARGPGSPLPRVGESDEVRAPATLGPWRPWILLPRGFAGRVADDELEFVIRHELAHLDEGHHAASLVQALARALFWWLPPARWLGRMQAAVQEQIADEAAVAGEADRRRYAELLIRLAESVARRGRAPLGLSIGASPWGFDRRIVLILEGGRQMTRVSRSVRWALAAGGLSAGFLLAAFTVRADPASRDEGPTPTQQRQRSAQAAKPAPAPPGRQEGRFTVESFRKGRRIPVEAAKVEREDGKPPRITYPGSRTSSRFVAMPGGTRVAVSEGVEWRGKTAYLSLTFQLVVTEGASDKALWMSDVGAFWDTITFEDAAGAGEPERWAVVLESSRRPGFRKTFDLATGRELEAKDAPPAPAGDRFTPRRVWSGSAGVAKEPKTTLVGSAEAWDTLRATLFGDAGGIPAPDAIDFDREVLLVAYGGEQYNWSATGVEDAYEDADRLLVRLRRTTYQSLGQSPLEHPYGLIVLPRREGKPYVLERNAQNLIGGPPIWKEQVRLSLEQP